MRLDDETELAWSTMFGGGTRHRGKVEAFGEVLSIEAWSARTGIKAAVIRRRLKHLAPEAALSLSDYAHYSTDALPGGPKSWTWDGLSWERDPWAQQFVDEHPGGASLEEVGDAIGVTRERVRQIEEKAIRKLQRARAIQMLTGGVR